MKTNREGLTWSEWFAAATLGKNCCNANAWGACTTLCPRVHMKQAHPDQVLAWQRGEDPTDVRASHSALRSEVR